MPSENEGGASLKRRVAASSAVVAAVVGLVSAGSAALLLERLAVAAEDQRLRDSASILARELANPGVDVEQAARFEAAEDEPLGIRIGLFREGTLVGGSAGAPSLAESGCRAMADQSRACAVPSPHGWVVAEARSPASERQSMLVAVVALVSALSALLGALASRRLATWALSPLTDLNRRIANVGTKHPHETDLGEPSGSTEVEALRQTIAELLARLGSSLEHARRFGANAAHELRSPLAAMMVEIDLLRENGDAEAHIKLRRNVERLSILVDRLLQMSDAPARLTEETAVALEDVIQDVVNGRSSPERDRIRVDEGAGGMVRGDEALLRVAVDNLVDNALKFTKTRVDVAIETDGSDVVVRVRDDGEGVSEEEGRRLVKPFERGSSTVKGHGLGLAIAAHAVHLHGGAIEFSRTPRSEISLRLPAWRPEHQA